MVGKRRVRMASFTLRAGDVLAATWHPDILEPERFELDIVHSDADLVVIDKPSGQLSQGSELGDVGSLIHALERRFGRDVRLMHRLDKGASGLLVAGLNPAATAALTPQFRDHTLERRYVALVAGHPPAGPCETPLVIAGRTVRVARPGEDGLPARSDIAVLETRETPAGPRALIEVRLHTGRTHQIRVHLASLGAPLVGDPLYGGPEAPRLALHARVLGLVHPDGTTRRWERPPGPDFPNFPT
jgi:RluA family pseudouridine synthase